MKKYGEKRFPVAATKELCPVCTKENGGSIVLSKRATTLLEGQHEVDKLHGAVTGFSDKICDDCKEKVGDGIYFILVDEEQSTDMKNPYRTGEIHGIRKEAVERMFENDPMLPEFIKKQCLFIDYNIARQMGLPTTYNS